jgi:hypothetical protein
MQSVIVSSGTKGNLYLQRIAEALERMGIRNADAEFERAFNDRKLGDLIAWQHLRTLFQVVDEFSVRLDLRAQIKPEDLVDFDTERFFVGFSDKETPQAKLNRLTSLGYDGGVMDASCLIFRPARRMTATEAKKILALNPCLGPSGFAHLVAYAKGENRLLDITSPEDEAEVQDITLLSLEASVNYGGPWDSIPTVRLQTGRKPELAWTREDQPLPENAAIVGG